MEAWVAEHTARIVGTLAVAAVLIAAGMAWVMTTSHGTREQVNVIEERTQVAVCENPDSARCEGHLDHAIDAMNGEQALRILRKARRHLRALRRRASRGGGSQQTGQSPSQSPRPPSGGRPPLDPPGPPFGQGQGQGPPPGKGPPQTPPGQRK